MRIFLFLFLIFLSFPASAFAHTFGQPPFFTINGVFSNLYPVPTGSVADFNLPQDLAADNYLINQNLDFELVMDKLPAPKEVIEQTNFSWDFGDGKYGTGLKNRHQYTKPGSYILTIKAKYLTDPQAQLLQSVLFNVLPNKDYKLPQTIIKANNRQSKDPLTDILKVDFATPVELDGSSSTSGSAKISSYSWDLGDTNGSGLVKLTHQYDQQLGQVFPVLRVKDENGFISDSYIELQNGQDFGQNPGSFISENLHPQKLADSSNPVARTIIYIAAGILSLAAGFLFKEKLRLFLKLIKKGRKKV